MTQITINIENKAIIPHLKKILNALDGVSVASPQRKKKSGLAEAVADVKAGRINRYESADDFFKTMGI